MILMTASFLYKHCQKVNATSSSCSSTILVSCFSWINRKTELYAVGVILAWPDISL